MRRTPSRIPFAFPGARRHRCFAVSELDHSGWRGDALSGTGSGHELLPCRAMQSGRLTNPRLRVTLARDAGQQRRAASVANASDGNPTFAIPGGDSVAIPIQRAWHVLDGAC